MNKWLIGLVPGLVAARKAVVLGLAIGLGLGLIAPDVALLVGGEDALKLCELFFRQCQPSAPLPTAP